MILAPAIPSGEGGAYSKGQPFLTIRHEGIFTAQVLKFRSRTSRYRKDSFTLYLGPVDYYTLKDYKRNSN